MQNEVYILSGIRTPIGTFGGSLATTSPIDLGTLVTSNAIEKANLYPNQIGHVAFGHVINTEPRDMYLSRVISINSKIPETTPAFNVNRLCGSGAQAIVSMYQTIFLGDTDFAVAGGSENMSLSPYIVKNSRWGKKMGNVLIEDMMLGALNCPFGTGHMGVTAENVAKKYNISREEQDQFALTSQKKALNALKNNHFEDQTISIDISNKKEKKIFKKDEHLKETSLDNLSKLKPVFVKDGTVTAGNSSGLNDGAAAIVLGSKKATLENNLNPVARIIGYAHSGVDPMIMGIGPITAVKKLCEKTSLKINDFDVIESNEAFAAQACAVNKALDINHELVNPNGGAIALGHPIGATGTILVIKAISELKRLQKKLGLITMCIGGGQGIAIAIENL